MIIRRHDGSPLQALLKALGVLFIYLGIVQVVVSIYRETLYLRRLCLGLCSSQSSPVSFDSAIRIKKEVRWICFMNSRSAGSSPARDKALVI